MLTRCVDMVYRDGRRYERARARVRRCRGREIRVFEAIERGHGGRRGDLFAAGEGMEHSAEGLPFHGPFFKCCSCYFPFLAGFRNVAGQIKPKVNRVGIRVVTFCRPKGKGTND